MIACRIPLVIAVFAALAAAAVPESVQRDFDSCKEKIARTPATGAWQFRSLVNHDLRNRYPDLAAAISDPGDAAAAKTGPQVPPPKESRQAKAIQKRIDTIGSLPSAADRARAIAQIAADIRTLPPGTRKITLAWLNSASKGGDQASLDAATAALAQALREIPAPWVLGYLELASRVRYQSAAPPGPDPYLDAAMAILELRDALRQDAGFSLTGADGKTYKLEDLRGHVVLINFWATWCGPCRKEMPDMEKLYRRLAGKGLVVLAVSEEKPGTLRNFASGHGHTFPLLSDPDHRVHKAYFVEGLPSSFVIDREGKLVAQADGARTEEQFLEMLKAAGLD